MMVVVVIVMVVEGFVKERRRLGGRLRWSFCFFAAPDKASPVT